MADYDSIKEQWKNMAIEEHINDSDIDLQKCVLEGAHFINGLPINGHVSSEMLKKLGEVEACSEIMQVRQKGREELKAAHEKWEKEFNEKQDKAILSLKTALTPNGQLIIAILEEKGEMTEDQIASWCDELETLDSEDINIILTDLVSEGILLKKDDAYSLQVVCDERVQWNKKDALRKIEVLSQSNEELYKSFKAWKRDMEAALFVLDSEEKPICGADVARLLNDPFLQATEDVSGFKKYDPTNAASFLSITFGMEALEKAGILQKAFNSYDGTESGSAFWHPGDKAKVYAGDADYYDFGFIGGAK